MIKERYHNNVNVTRLGTTKPRAYYIPYGTPEEAKLKKLQKENEELRQQVEILKKAAAYFAKHPADE